MLHIEFTKLTKVLFWFFLLLLTTSISATYYRYMIQEDYEVFVEYDTEDNLINYDDFEE